MPAAISEDVANRLSFAGSEAYTVIGHSLDASSSSNKMDLSPQNSYVKDGVLYCNHCTRGQGLMNEEKEIWPPSHPRRTLVLCFDGTGDQFDSDNSNVVELIKILKKDDISKQMVYYQAGIGTYTIPQIATPLMAAFDKKVDEAVAWHINSHVMGGYEFLMQNYNHGDRICLFGFSRGAYIARSLGGMLHKVGLLPPCNHQQVPFAYKMYTTVDETGWKQANAFKKAFSMDVDVEFLGVWDTVSSVGLIPRYLPFPTSNTFIRTFRHAVSLDERRAKFKANLWNRPTAKELALSDFDSDNPRNKMGAVYDENNQIPDEEIDYIKDRNSPTDIKEVWFAGCHCDVGGGSVSNETTVNLARIPLRWMIRECFRRKTGILFVKEGLESLGLKPESLWPVVQQRPPALSPGESDFISRDLSSMTITTAPTVATEEELDLMDALSPIYDQLSLKKMWWLLEIPPLLFYYQGKNNYWYSVLRSNLGRSRDPPANGKMLVHRSVWTRMQARYKDKSESKYKPSIPFDPETVEWVD